MRTAPSLRFVSNWHDPEQAKRTRQVRFRALTGPLTRSKLLHSRASLGLRREAALEQNPALQCSICGRQYVNSIASPVGARDLSPSGNEDVACSSSRACLAASLVTNRSPRQFQRPPLRHAHAMRALLLENLAVLLLRGATSPHRSIVQPRCLVTRALPPWLRRAPPAAGPIARHRSSRRSECASAPADGCECAPRPRRVRREPTLRPAVRSPGGVEGAREGRRTTRSFDREVE